MRRYKIQDNGTVRRYDSSDDLERARFDVFAWRSGDRWRLVLEAVPLREAIRETIVQGRTGSACAIPYELEANPNRMTARELADLAEITAGPIPDLLRGAA